jgi:hypothetical protein
MTATDVKSGFTVEFVQSVATNALALYEADPVKNREPFANALGFLQGVTTLDLAKLQLDLHRITIEVPPEAETRPGPKLTKRAVGGKAVSAVDVAAVAADTKAIFGLK